MLCIDHVHKSFTGAQGFTKVLSGVHLHIKAGGLVSLLGRSGSGKTTLLRLIAGYEAPDAGAILFEEVKVSGPSPERFMVFQEYNQLFPWMRVRKNLLFALQEARPKLDPKQREERAQYWLNETELSQDADKWPRQLSGGMKQRAALARAFALQPKLLLLDEPFTGLDAVLRRSMQQLLRSLCEKHGVSALFVTHDIDEALTLCEYPVVLTPDGAQLRRIPAGEAARAQIIQMLAQQ